jgi:hypothetical protein
MRFAFFIQQNVTRFDVAMKDTALMRIVDCARQLRNELRGAARRHWLVFEYFVELAALDEGHTEVAVTVALADFVNWDNAWMV